MATPIVSLATIQQTIARAISRYPDQRARIERGAALIILGHVEQDGPDAFAVRSQTDAGVTYALGADGCDCVDAQRHPGQSCKHRWAVDIVQVAAERERRLAARSARATDAVVSAETIALAHARRIGWVA